jgi:hypothetical protein
MPTLASCVTSLLLLALALESSYALDYSRVRRAAVPFSAALGSHNAGPSGRPCPAIIRRPG